MKRNNERPSQDDIGKPAWVWPLPGTHRSQIRSGVLMGPGPDAHAPDSEDLKLRISGTDQLFPWSTIVLWDTGSPPNRDTIKNLRDRAKAAHAQARDLEGQGASRLAEKEHRRADILEEAADDLEQRMGS